MLQTRRQWGKNKRVIREAKSKEFWRKSQPKFYLNVKHLEMTQAKISLWALLMSLLLHSQDLMKALFDRYVPVGTSSNNLSAIINPVI